MAENLYDGKARYTEDGYVARFWLCPLKAMAAVKRYRRRIKQLEQLAFDAENERRASYADVRPMTM